MLPSALGTAAGGGGVLEQLDSKVVRAIANSDFILVVAFIVCENGASVKSVHGFPCDRDMISKSMRLRILLSATLLVLHLSAAPPVDFARDIRPILSDRCFSCHGPDESKRQAGLRLDTEDGAKKSRGPRTPVVPGDISASEILKRVAPENPARRMPPPYSDRKPLTEKEVATLRAWIEQGAKWQGHWSFTPPVRSTEPSVRNRNWVRNPIDSFILARLESEGLVPSPEADRPPAAARQLRPHRSTTHLGRTRFLPRGPFAGRLREGSRPPAGLAAIR
jgi:hypothetical protein